MERRDVGADAGRRHRAEVDDRVEGLGAVDAAERVDDLAVVGQIDLDESGFTGADDVESDHVVPGIPQFAEDDGAEFAG